jgi:hypothetical protein
MEAKEILPKDLIDKQVYQYAHGIIDMIAEIENEVNKSVNIFNDLFTGKLHAINVYAEQQLELINSKEGDITS